jgi:hypothetical protein
MTDPMADHVNRLVKGMVARMPALRVYKLDISGVLYWCSARSASEALGLCLFVENDASEDHPNSENNTSIDWNAFELFLVPEVEAAETKLRADGDPSDDTTMWLAHLESTVPRVLACSEWP